MANDIIAESQTQRTVDALMRGDADTRSQQVALAALLQAVTRQNEKLNEIEKSLWKRDDINSFIDKRHEERCANCPAKKLVSDRQKTRPWYLELMTSESLRSYILVLILVWTVIAMKTTSEENARILSSFRSTITAGQR